VQDRADRAASWFRGRSSTWRDWPLPRVLADKARHSSRISLVIPARNEAHTVAGIVAELTRTLQKDAPLLDEVIVIDSDSTDDTAHIAARAGATVFRASDIATELGSRPGKGEALWKSLFVADGDLLVFVDGDLTDWGPHFVTGLLGPLLADENIQLVRAAYTRLRSGPDGSVTADGGRLTELVARPLLSLYWPELTGVAQPLAGEWAVRRSLIEALPIPVGYGVELSTLLDTASRHGLDAIAQVHLGRRGHRHRSDREMALAATELLAVAESRRGHRAMAGSAPVRLQQFEPAADGWGTPVARLVEIDERPPCASVRAANLTGVKPS
jgi:glucosyl-3-phosphoglycerate synthase